MAYPAWSTQTPVRKPAGACGARLAHFQLDEQPQVQDWNGQARQSGQRVSHQGSRGIHLIAVTSSDGLKSGQDLLGGLLDAAAQGLDELPHCLRVTIGPVGHVVEGVAAGVDAQHLADDEGD